MQQWQPEEGDVHLLLTLEEAATLLAIVASARTMIAHGTPMPGLARTQRTGRALSAVMNAEAKLRAIVTTWQLRP